MTHDLPRSSRLGQAKVVDVSHLEGPPVTSKLPALLSRRRFWTVLGVACATSMTLAACSGGSSSSETSTAESSTITSQTSTSSEETTSTTESQTDDADATTSTSSTVATTAPTTAAPTTTANNFGGQPYDIGPAAGQPVVVVGVRYDDVLNLRDAPNAGATIVGTAAPLSQSPTLLSAGSGLLFTDSAWWAIAADGTPAWVNTTFIGGLGTTQDIFGQMYGGIVPDEAATIQALAEVIGEKRADGPVPLVVLVTEPEADDAIGGRVLFDVIGLGDDAVKGERIEMQFEFVWDNPVADNRAIVGHRVVALSSTAICARGLADAGLCL